MFVFGTDEADAWHEWIEKLPPEYRDIHWSPELYRVYERVYEFTSSLLVAIEGTNFAIQACFCGGSGMRHVYNFGGPLGSAAVGLPWELVEWKRKIGVKREYCTLHPLFEEQQREILQSHNPIQYIKNAVYIDLDKPLTLRTTHRQMCRYAHEAGVTIVQCSTLADNLTLFDRMYQASMDRKNAADHWRVHDTFFSTMAACLGEKMALFFAYVKGELEAGCVVIHDYDTVYYHYAASIGVHSRIGVNHAMVVYVAEWAKERGYKRLFLGGGVKPDDGLYLFKTGFSKERAAVYRYEVVT